MPSKNRGAKRKPSFARRASGSAKKVGDSRSRGDSLRRVAVGSRKLLEGGVLVAPDPGRRRHSLLLGGSF